MDPTNPFNLPICGYIVDLLDGRTTVFNSELKDLAHVQTYAIDNHGTYEPFVRLSVAEAAIREARGEFETMKVKS